MGVVNLNLIAVGIVNQSQETVDKVHLVVLVVANHIAAGAVLVDFQPHAVFIIIVVGVFAGIFGEIMDRTVAIGIFHIGGFVVGIAIVLQLYLFHSLHDTEVDSGAYMHAQAKPAAGVIVLLAVSHGIAAVVGQIQGDRVYRGGVGYQVFTQGQLTAEVSNICRTGIANSHGLIGIVVLDAVGAPVGSHKVHLAVVGEPGAVLGTGTGVGGHHQTVIAPTIVPLFRGGCNIPEQNVVDGGIAGIHIVQRGPVRRAVGPGQAAVQGGALGNFAHIQHH